MRGELKFFIYAMGLGMALVAYAHSNFTTKDISHIILDKLNRLDEKVDRLLIKQ